MAVALRTSVAGGGTSGTSNRTVTITPAVGDLFVVFVSLSGNTSSTLTMTDNNGSGTYDRIGNALWASSANNSAVFVRTALMANTTSTVITCNSGSNTAGELVVLALTGAVKVGSAAVRSSGSQANQTTGTTGAPALNQAALTTNFTIAALASDDTTTTPNASWTERQDASQSTPTTALEVATRDSGFTGTTITFGASTTGNYATWAIEINGDNDGALSQTVSVTQSATGELERLGAVSQTVSVTTAPTGTVLVQGTSAQTVGPTLTFTGQVEILATSTNNPVTLTASGTGTVDVLGVLSRTIAVTQLVEGTVATGGVAGELAQTIAVTPSAQGTAEYIGGVNVSVLVDCVVSGTVDTFGQASPSIGLSGSSTGIVEFRGTLNQTITVALTATNSVIQPRLAVGAETVSIGLLATGTNPPIPVPNLGRQGYLDYILGRFHRR